MEPGNYRLKIIALGSIVIDWFIGLIALKAMLTGESSSSNFTQQYGMQRGLLKVEGSVGYNLAAIDVVMSAGAARIVLLGSTARRRRRCS
ncbi:MAG: hypothetical protein NTV68_11495 [Methanomicrobiales archaeon]|nr:hypothetical protein [Methanomicrobiales archaeon]